MMRVEDTPLRGVKLIHSDVYGDDRGWFTELWRAERYEVEGFALKFVQDNVSYSGGGVIRGLHYQHPYPQAKLVMPVSGEIWDVAVDVRPYSPTFRQWYGAFLSPGRQLFIPAGFAHGFAVTSAAATVIYKCSAPYRQHADRCIRWDDPWLGIEWPVSDPVLSDKDRSAKCLSEIPPEELPSDHGVVFNGSG